MGPGIFLKALIAPFLYAITNHIDKILLEKYFKEGGVGTLMLFSSCLSIFAVIVIAVLKPYVLHSDAYTVGVMSFVGFLNLVLLWCYLQAMDGDEPTVVIIFYQLVPVLGLGFGYGILGETISRMQGIAMSLIIIGAAVMTFATDVDGKIVLKFRSVVYMLIASACWAGEATLFKMVAIEEDVWQSLFWENVSMTVLGVMLFSFVPHYRRNFLKAWKANSRPIIGLNVFNEVVYMFGNAAASFVVVLIPVSLNLLMNSFQPFFVLMMGIAINKFIPGLSTETSTDRWKQKTFAIIITGIGVYLIGDW